MRLCLALALAAGLLAAFSGVPASIRPAAAPVLVELFTSQGCSSCPPADAVIERLAREPGIVAVSRPVTYWDRLGWKDTFAREVNTDLQKAYASRGGEGSGVYTPQAVVQGRTAIVGSREAGLRRLIAAERNRLRPAVTVAELADGARSINIGAGTRTEASVTILALRSSAVVRIGAGENGGRMVRYTNIVVAETGIGRWRGMAERYRVAGTVFRRRDADRYALIVRSGESGPVIAARYI
jgi:hypothetical protein